jgi:hypothetical protein
MKYFIFLLSFVCVSYFSFAQTKVATVSTINKALPLQTVEVSCGQCQFKMEGTGCNLAVKIKGKTYFADGTNIDDHGDAHSDEGFCKAIRKAEVQGKIVKGRFKVSYFKLL